MREETKRRKDALTGKAKKMMENIEKTDPGRYSMTVSEVLTLAKIHNNDMINASYDLFRYGFLKGQRAMKAESKRKGDNIMNEMQIFENSEFGKVRTTEINGAPYVIAKDICEIFGDSHYRRSIQRLDDEDKALVKVNTNGGAPLKNRSCSPKPITLMSLWTGICLPISEKRRNSLKSGKRIS